MAPVTGGGFVRVHVTPPSLDIAVLALLGSPGSRSPPPTIPCKGLRNATVNAPALGELTSGVSYAFHVLPPSPVASTRAIVDPPVAIQAFCPPSVATHVPLAANDASPGKAGGILLLILCQFVPSPVTRVGKTPFTESLCEMPRFGPQNEKQSSTPPPSGSGIASSSSPRRQLFCRYGNPWCCYQSTASTRPWHLPPVRRGIAVVRPPVPRRPSMYFRPVGCHRERARAPGSPDHLRVHWTHRNQSVDCAVLRSRDGQTIFFGPCAFASQKPRSRIPTGNASTWHCLPQGLGAKYRLQPNGCQTRATISLGGQCAPIDPPANGIPGVTYAPVSVLLPHVSRSRRVARGRDGIRNYGVGLHDATALQHSGVHHHLRSIDLDDRCLEH